MKGKSVLVDFYNLHLEYKTSDKNKQEEFIDFFKSYAPHVLKKLTEEEKQKIREIYSDFEKYGQNKKIYDDLYYNDLMIDGLTTLEGFEVVYHKSWFNSFYLVFSGENLRIQRIIDRYLDERRVAFADLRWLESNSRMYWLMDFIMTAWYWGDYHVHLVNDDNDQEMVMEFYKEMALKFGITSLSRLFLSIYNDTIRVLEGKLEIDRCIAYETRRKAPCSNIFIDFKKQGPPQQFCSEKCRKRIHEHEKKHPEDRDKRHAILDAKMENKR